MDSWWDKARKSGLLGTANKANYETEAKGLKLQPWYKGSVLNPEAEAESYDDVKKARDKAIGKAIK